MASFQDWVVADYAASPVKHLIGIEEYVELVTKNQPSVTVDDLYDPIPVNVQLCGMQAVPVQIDYSASWYERLCNAVGTMCQVSGSDVELKDIRGHCINDATAADLERIGKVKAYARGKRINLPRLPEPPQHMSNDKIEKLCNWFDASVYNNLVSTITDHLVGVSSKIELQPRTAVSSDLSKAIAAVVNDNCIGGDATQFMRSFGSNERAKNTAPADMANNCARVVLQRVRQNLRGAVTKIDRHLAAKAAIALQNTGDTEDLFGEIGSDVTAKLEDERQMYEKIARKALANKMDVVNCIYRATPIQCDCDDKKKKKKTNTKEDQYYADYYYGTNVYQRYQQFSGSSVFMEPGVRGARLRKKQYQQAQMVADLPQSAKSELPNIERMPSKNVKASFPGVTPIASEARTKFPGVGLITSEQMPELKRVPEQRKVSFPGVERIASKNVKASFPGVTPISSEARSEFPGVERIASDEMPGLKRVPEQRKAPFPGVERIASKNVKASFPGVTPIASEARSEFPGVERIASEEMPDMPGLKRVPEQRKAFPGVERIASKNVKASFPGVERIESEEMPGLKRVPEQRKAFPGDERIASKKVDAPVQGIAKETKAVPRINDGYPDIFDF